MGLFFMSFTSEFVQGVLEWLILPDDVSEDELLKRTEALNKAVKRYTNNADTKSVIPRLWREIDRLQTLVAQDDPAIYEPIVWFYELLDAVRIYADTRRHELGFEIGRISRILHNQKATSPTQLISQILNAVNLNESPLDEENATDIKAVADYIQCPYRYKLRYVAGIQPLPFGDETSLRDYFYNQNAPLHDKQKKMIDSLEVMGIWPNQRIQQRLQTTIDGQLIYGDVDLDLSETLRDIRLAWQPEYEVQLQFAKDVLGLESAEIIDVSASYHHWMLVRHAIVNDEIKPALEGITTQRFDPLPEKSKCKRCGVRLLCRYRK